tara:strand:- start:523 stop:900 length:378 start_codon:yes stop_codon:yes gene_type:complete
MKQQLISVASLLFLDLVWVGLVASRLYSPMVKRIQGGGEDMQVKVGYAVLAYALMVVGLLVFCMHEEVGEAAWRGAVFGTVVYGVYVFTCASILKDFRAWPEGVADVAWGATVYASSSALGVALS